MITIKITNRDTIENNDWSFMIFCMLSRYLNSKDISLKIIDEGKSKKHNTTYKTILIEDDSFYENLKFLSGVHRLVRISPFDAQKRRFTSFTLVEIEPEFYFSSREGQAIISYITSPYSMIKDYRFDYETSNVDDFLSGNLDEYFNNIKKYYKEHINRNE